MVTKIQQIEGMNKRLEKAKQLVAEGKTKTILGIESHYVVESTMGNGLYLVNEECTCPDAKYRIELHDGWCKHSLSVELLKDEQRAMDEVLIKVGVESLYGPQHEEKE